MNKKIVSLVATVAACTVFAFWATRIHGQQSFTGYRLWMDEYYCAPDPAGAIPCGPHTHNAISVLPDGESVHEMEFSDPNGLSRRWIRLKRITVSEWPKLGLRYDLDVPNPPASPAIMDDENCRETASKAGYSWQREEGLQGHSASVYKNKHGDLLWLMPDVGCAPVQKIISFGGSGKPTYQKATGISIGFNDHSIFSPLTASVKPTEVIRALHRYQHTHGPMAVSAEDEAALWNDYARTPEFSDWERRDGQWSSFQVKKAGGVLN